MTNTQPNMTGIEEYFYLRRQANARGVTMQPHDQLPELEYTMISKFDLEDAMVGKYEGHTFEIYYSSTTALSDNPLGPIAKAEYISFVIVDETDMSLNDAMLNGIRCYQRIVRGRKLTECNIHAHIEAGLYAWLAEIRG